MDLNRQQEKYFLPMFKYANCFQKPPSDNSGTFSFIENGDKNGFLNRTAGVLKQMARTRLFCQRRRVLTVFRRRPLTIKGAFPVISPVDGKYHIFIWSLSVKETVWTDSYDELKFYVSFSLNINSFLVLQKSTHVFLRQVDKTYEPM